MPPNEATILPDKVKIKSWNPSKNGYNEFEAEYDQILTNLKEAKIPFLIKNIAKEQILENDFEKDNSEISSSEEEKKPAPTANSLGSELKKQSSVAEKNVENIPIPIPMPQPTQKQEPPQGTAFDQLEMTAERASRARPKGPKKTLIQLPQLTPDKDDVGAPQD